MIKHVCALILCLMMMPLGVQASAWLPEVQEKELITTGRYTDGQSVRQFEINPYFESGFTDSVSGGVNATYRTAHSDSSTGSDYQMAFAELFAKYLLKKTDFNIFSAQLTAGTTGDTLNVASSDLSYSPKPVAEVRGLWGTSTADHDWGSVFLNSEVAIRTFFGEKGNEFRGEETLGFKLPSEKMLLGQLFWTKNWNETLGARDYDVLQFQGSVVIPVSTLKYQMGVNIPVAGRNVSYDPVYILSVWYGWK